MVQKLEAIKGGGGSIKVGTTGTIGSLMTRELNSVKPVTHTEISCGEKPGSIPVSVASGASAPKRSQPRKPLDEASSSSVNHSHPETPRKTKGYSKNTHRIPMLGPDAIALDRNPSRVNSDKKASNIVEIVDVKCGNQDTAWASPITSRLKKLGFSKLSQSVV